MDIGAQSVAVFARPALPHADATSGNVMRIESSTWSRRRCVVRDTAGRGLGMYISDPSFNGGMNSLPRPANGRSVSTRTPTAPPSTSHRAPIAQRSTGRYTLIAQRLRGFSASARIFPLTNHPMSAGTSVTESSAAAAIAKVLVSASGRNSRPSWSSSVNTGRNESVMMSSDMNSAGPTSRAAANTRSQCGRSGSWSKCLWRFSSITIAASIMAPIAIASPPRPMILPLMPSPRAPASEPRIPSGSAPILAAAARYPLDVTCPTEVAEPADGVIRARDLHRARPRILVGPAHGHDDLARRYAVAEEPGRVEQNLVLAHEAAQTRDLGYARHGLQGVPHLKVLDRAEPVGRVAGTLEGVLIDPAYAGGVGP